jgi:hypothetical protein
MKAALTAILVFCGLAQADPKLLTFDKTGRLISQTEAAIRTGGVAYVSRDALYGAASGLVEDGRGGMHPVLWVTADDVETGVAAVWIGLQAPAGPDESTQKPELAQGSAHTAKVLEPKETGAEGVLARLECSGGHGPLSEPLYDEHGLFAGWHVSRTVDGKVFSFIVPGGRIRAMPPERLTLADWNARHAAEPESTFAKAVGHLWADDIEGALFYLRKAVDADPANARAWLQLGFAEGKAGQGKQRIRSYRKAIELDPTLCAARYLLGVNLLMTGNRDEAQAQYKALKAMNSPYAVRLKSFIDSMHVDELGDKKVRHRHTNGSA